MDEILLFSTIIAPIILAIVEVFKRAVNFPKNYIPVVAIVVGVVVGYFSSSFSDLDTSLRIWSGILAGLSSVGLFEFFKTNVGTTKGEK